MSVVIVIAIVVWTFTLTSGEWTAIIVFMLATIIVFGCSHAIKRILRYFQIKKFNKWIRQNDSKYGISWQFEDHFYAENIDTDIYLSENEKAIVFYFHTFINPYEQDIKKIYNERVMQFKAMKDITVRKHHLFQTGYEAITVIVPYKKSNHQIYDSIARTCKSIIEEEKSHLTRVFYKFDYGIYFIYSETKKWYPERSVVIWKEDEEVPHSFCDSLNYYNFEEEQFTPDMTVVYEDAVMLESVGPLTLISQEEFEQAWEGKQRECLIALGANNHSEHNILLAQGFLKELMGEEVFFTQTIETEAIGMEGPHFLNCIARVYTAYPLDYLNLRLKQMEQACGNTPEKRAERIIELDLDILQYGNERHHEKDWDRPYIQQLLQEIHPTIEQTSQPSM